MSQFPFRGIRLSVSRAGSANLRVAALMRVSYVSISLRKNSSGSGASSQSAFRPMTGKEKVWLSVWLGAELKVYMMGEWMVLCVKRGC